MPDDELLALDDALTRLTGVDTRAVEVVKLCFSRAHARAGRLGTPNLTGDD
ncbi:MAG: hypothetical protein ABI680_03910 [Chthoniobacteraceae bacterium]